MSHNEEVKHVLSLLDVCPFCKSSSLNLFIRDGYDPQVGGNTTVPIVQCLDCRAEAPVANWPQKLAPYRHQDASRDYGWVPVDDELPKHPDGVTLHFPLQCFGVIDDPRYQLPDEEGPFMDIVTYWPAMNKWTVTHSCRADEGAADVEVRVTFWQPMMPLPAKYRKV